MIQVYSQTSFLSFRASSSNIYFTFVHEAWKQLLLLLVRSSPDLQNSCKGQLLGEGISRVPWVSSHWGAPCPTQNYFSQGHFPYRQYVGKRLGGNSMVLLRQKSIYALRHRGTWWCSRGELSQRWQFCLAAMLWASNRKLGAHWISGRITGIFCVFKKTNKKCACIAVLNVFSLPWHTL